MLRWYYTKPGTLHILYRKVTDYIIGLIDLYTREFGTEKFNIMSTFPLDSQMYRVRLHSENPGEKST